MSLSINAPLTPPSVTETQNQECGIWFHWFQHCDVTNKVVWCHTRIQNFFTQSSLVIFNWLKNIKYSNTSPSIIQMWGPCPGRVSVTAVTRKLCQCTNIVMNCWNDRGVLVRSLEISWGLTRSRETSWDLTRSHGASQVLARSLIKVQ